MNLLIDHKRADLDFLARHSILTDFSVLLVEVGYEVRNVMARV
jgi:hypothetical protein